jgi:hypothetical protein
MSISVTITLTVAGSNTGPFDLYSDVDSYATPFETGIAKSALVAGYTSNVVPSAATIIKCKSTNGTCNNFGPEFPISGLPGPTPTMTPTNTPTPTNPYTIYTFTMGYDVSNGWTACSNYAAFNRRTVYSYTPFSGLTNGSVIYKTSSIPLTDYADNGWYSDGTNFWIATAGSLYSQTPCSTPQPTPTMTPTPTLPPVGYGVYTGATFVSSILACADTNYPSITVYISPGDTLSNGDIVYSNYALTTPFVGNSQYYRIRKDASVFAAQISSGGYISNLTTC